MVVQQSAPRKSVEDWLLASAGPIVALFAIFAVHRLTKGRDREKAVFDLYKMVGDAVAALKPIIVKAWSDDDVEIRKAAVAESKWRLQQIGGFVERIRRQSRRWTPRGIMTPRPLAGIRYPSPPAGTPRWHWRSIRARTSPGLRTTGAWTRHVLWPPRWIVEIGLTSAMADLREEITNDPFDDPTRALDKTKSEAVELAVGSFLQALDERLFAWMD